MPNNRKCPDIFEPGALECLGCPDWLICGWAYCDAQEKATMKTIKEEKK